MQRKLIAFVVVAFVAGLGVGAVAANSTAADAQQPDRQQQSADTLLTRDEVADKFVMIRNRWAADHANITSVSVTNRSLHVETDRSVFAVRIEDESGAFLNGVIRPSGFRSGIYPLNFSASVDQSCGYDPDGPTQVVAYNESYTELDRVQINISAKTDVCTS